LKFDLRVDDWIGVEHGFDFGGDRSKGENACDCQTNYQGGEKRCHVRVAD